MATKQQIPTLAGAIVSNQNCFEPLPSDDTQWAIENTEEAMAIFVAAIQNRVRRVVKRTLAIWKSIHTGGGTPEELATKVGKSCEEVSPEAKFLMAQMTVAPSLGTVNLVVLTPRDLGFTSNPRTDAFITKEFCARWSAENLDGCVIELCEVEDGPRLREQYQDQPNGEVLWMAMERIADSGGRPRVFVVERYDDGLRWLFTRWTRPRDKWNLDYRLVFRFRKLPLPSVS